MQGSDIHAALKREHAYTGSYSAAVRMLRQQRGQLFRGSLRDLAQLMSLVAWRPIGWP